MYKKSNKKMQRKCAEKANTTHPPYIAHTHIRSVNCLNFKPIWLLQIIPCGGRGGFWVSQSVPGWAQRTAG